MGKILVLAEKPSVGKELARVLGAKQSKDGHIVGNKYIVTWSLGHLVTLSSPEAYGDVYKKWSLDTLPMLPKKMKLEVIKETSKQYKVVKSLLASNEIDELVIATDAGREGELVARWIIEKAGFKKPIKRLWISSQTDKAIKDGFNNLKDGKEYYNLYQSAKCRAEADWLVGLNITRALTCKHNAQLSAGRVQTPTLAMIVDRENEIDKFKPKEYYSIVAELDKFKLTWRDKKSKLVRSYDKDKMDTIVSKIIGSDAIISSIKKQEKKEQPPLLYDLTELQRDANKKYGFSPKQTLNLMQKLYETHKLLTYPRTDSRYLTSDIVPTLIDRLKSIAIGDYAKPASMIIKNKFTVTKRIADDSKVSDHHAIIPTEQYVDLGKLTADERRIYDLVVKRFLAALSAPFIYEQTSIDANINDEVFTAKGKVVQSNGWKAIYNNQFDEDADDDDEKEQSLPSMAVGDKFKVKKVKLNKGLTRPPARYTEATLLSAMEHPGKFISDKDLKDVLESAAGIGTPATRGDIIEKLFSSFYVEKRGKEIFPLSKGVQLVNIVPDDLRSPELTAKWEQELTAISKGQSKPTEFVNDIQQYASSLVSKVISSDAKYQHDNISRARCPLCDKHLLEVNGKKGKMLVCQDRECGYRHNVSIESNARCPQCKKKLTIIGDGDKKIYSCKCGFREKFDRFNQYLAENKAMMSKKEATRFMKKQQEEDVPSPFAVAFAKANKE